MRATGTEKDRRNEYWRDNMVAWYSVSLAKLELFPRILLLYSSELGLATRATERDTEAGSKAVAITLVKQWPLRKAGVIHITCGSSAGSHWGTGRDAGSEVFLLQLLQVLGRACISNG